MNKLSVSAVLSDASGVIIEDNNYGKSLMKSLVRLTGIKHEKLWNDFGPYVQKARTLPNYSNTDALRDFLTSLSIDAGCVSSVLACHQAHPRLSVFPGVHHTLRNLKAQGIKFVIVSDATVSAEKMRPALVSASLADLVSDVVSSKDVGVTKPDSRIFEYALQRNGLRKQDVIFVGHEFDELYGAHQLGYNVAAVNYNPADDLRFIPEERKLAQFADILNIVCPKQQT